MTSRVSPDADTSRPEHHVARDDARGYDDERPDQLTRELPMGVR
ncbi:MAG TPA: hypothetical protein VFS08_19565 [Gemmatimonadaceae bacterium]|nr:hypothetical protein [Gemmatimonadaceae bacterium]